MNKLQKRRQADQIRLIEDLEAEKAKLEFLRNCPHISDAINFYISRVISDRHEIEELRECLLYLSRGE